MADRKKTTKAPVRAAAPTRSSRGKSREGAFFPVSPPRVGLPPDYAETLKYMRTFAAVWPEREIVQRVVAQLPWRQNIALLERLDAANLHACRNFGEGRKESGPPTKLTQAVSEIPWGHNIVLFYHLKLRSAPRPSCTPNTGNISRERLHLMGGPAR